MPFSALFRQTNGELDGHPYCRVRGHSCHSRGANPLKTRDRVVPSDDSRALVVLVQARGHLARSESSAATIPKLSGKHTQKNVGPKKGA